MTKNAEKEFELKDIDKLSIENGEASDEEFIENYCLNISSMLKQRKKNKGGSFTFKKQLKITNKSKVSSLFKPGIIQQTKIHDKIMLNRSNPLQQQVIKKF